MPPYAGGRLGVSAPLIAKWDGQSWAKPGGGLQANGSFADIAAMAVFDDGSGPALYAGGSDFRVPGGPVCSVAKWDGKAWTTVGQNLGGRVWDLAVFGHRGNLSFARISQPWLRQAAKEWARDVLPRHRGGGH